MNIDVASLAEIESGALYTRSEVARYLRCGILKVSNLIHSGELPAKRIGGGPFRILGEHIIAVAGIDLTKRSYESESQAQREQRAMQALNRFN